MFCISVFQTLLATYTVITKDILLHVIAYNYIYIINIKVLQIVLSNYKKLKDNIKELINILIQ